MSQLTLFSNDQKITLEGDVELISKIISSLSFSPTLIQEETKPEKTKNPQVSYLEIMSQELDQCVPGGRFFAAELSRLYHHNQNNYSPLSNVYRSLVNKPADGWHQRRQILLNASAIWRYIFKPNSRLRYEILASAECSDCGRFVSSMLNHLRREGLWV